MEKRVADDDTTFDWCDHGAVAEVKTQTGYVCWAFSTMATIESINYIASKKLITMSEQYLIDCDDLNKGFTTGSQLKAFKYIMKKGGGVYKDSDYPFKGKKCDCECSKHKIVAKIDGFAKVLPQHNEEVLKKAVRGQPVTSFLDLRYVLYYEKGILRFDPTRDLDAIRKPEEDGSVPLHGIVIVGYGNEEGIEYWKCRNSYGPNWGERGYFRLRRNDPSYPDPFHIAKRCFYPWIKGVNEPSN